LDAPVPNDRIQQRGADLLRLVDEHLYPHSDRLPLRADRGHIALERIPAEIDAIGVSQIAEAG